MSQLSIHWQQTKTQAKTIQYLEDNITEEVLMGGAAGGGKSWLGCAWQTKRRLKYPNTRGFIGRKELKRLKGTTLLSLFDVVKSWGVGELMKINWQDSVINFVNGSKIFLLDLDVMPSDPEFERLGSYEFTDGFIDEAGEISGKCIDVLRGRFRYNLINGRMKLLMTCNPSKNFLYREFYKPYRDGTLPKHKIFIPSLAKDNPFLPPNYVKSLANISDNTTKQRLLYGNWEYDNDPARLLEYDEILDLFTNPVEPDLNNKYLSCDVARLGKDKTVVGIWHGLLCKFKTNNVNDRTRVNETVAMLERIEREEQIRRSNVIIDEDGVGGGVVDFHSGAKGFVNNSKPIKTEFEQEQEKEQSTIKQNYANLKTQCAFKFAELAKQGFIKIECNDEEMKQAIIEELEQLKRDKIDKDGKLYLLSKDKIKENIGRSPDYLDTLIMRMFFELKIINKFKYFEI